MISSTFEKSTSGKYHAIAATAIEADGTEVEGKNGQSILLKWQQAGLLDAPSQLSCGAKENSANLSK